MAGPSGIVLPCTNMSPFNETNAIANPVVIIDGADVGLNGYGSDKVWPKLKGFQPGQTRTPYTQLCDFINIFVSLCDTKEQ